MVEIADSNYETVTARCEHCGATCIFSRTDDLKTIGTVSGERVTCASCTRQFWINTDVLNTPYEFLIDDAREHLQIKRYMPAIASLAQAWEVFFAHFACGRYVYAPFFATDLRKRDAEALNDLSHRLTAIIGNFTFAPMRNLMIHTAARDIRPLTMPDAVNAIDRIGTDGFRDDPPALLYAQVADAETRAVLEQASQLTVGRLRNNVIHKYAYRPHRAEVEPCFADEVEVLRRLKRQLGVMDFMEYQMGAV